MKTKPFIITAFVMMVLLMSGILTKHYTAHSKTETMLTHHSQKQIDSIVHSAMRNGKIPGVSVLIIKDNKIFLNKGYGYANVSQKTKVTPRTRFEIASNTKAFTGYSVLQLAKEGKLNLNDKVSKYVPGFYMNYDDEKKDITIKQLLGHTSGIPSDITEEDHYSEDYNSIKNIVDYAKGKELNEAPGDAFEYSNMNYDILGLIVQNVSHQSYQSYIKEHILSPLNMKDTTFKTTSKKGKNEASGYELISGDTEKTTPEFNIGDTPSAFMMSSTKDLENWIKMQLEPSDKTRSIVEQSHQAISKSEGIADANGYGEGWFINSNDHTIYHTGTLDNFSSEILLNPKKSYGIVVLANMNSSHVTNLTDNLNSQILNNDHYTTIEQKIDQSANFNHTITILSCIGTFIFLILSLSRLNKLKLKRIVYDKRKIAFISFLLLLTLFVLFSIAIYLLPLFILGNASWTFVLSWLPIHAKWLIASFYIFMLMIMIWLSVVILTRQPKT
ncbi:serine hydrolase domain-containing protein [Staphylococcus caprae]|uniref:serine hydrolase domain-containing protein n=1 Tax=Staphylococcus caprae TaxID=29380 RepID=UPI000F8372AF|nr:serine hydrolase domain-containing protein [Staphylococcus caprae]